MESCTNHAVWCTTIVRVRIFECVFLKCVKNTFFLVHWSVFESVVFQWQLCHFHLIDLHTAFWNTCASVRKCVCVAEQTPSCWKFQMTLKMGFERCYSTRICELTAICSVSPSRVSQCICSIFLNLNFCTESPGEVYPWLKNIQNSYRICGW